MQLLRKIKNPLLYKRRFEYCIGLILTVQASRPLPSEGVLWTNPGPIERGFEESFYLKSLIIIVALFIIEFFFSLFCFLKIKDHTINAITQASRWWAIFKHMA